MNAVIGDLAHSLVLRQQGTDLRASMQRLTVELSSGTTSDLNGRLGGDFTFYGDVERGLESARSFERAGAEAANFTNAMQTALGSIQSAAQEAGSRMLSTSYAEDTSLLSAASNDAAGRLNAMLQTLNLQAGNRMVFAGNEPSQAPFIDGETMMDSIAAAVTAAGATTPADVYDAVTDWFDLPGGAFETTAYLGSTTALAPMKISDRTEIALNVTGERQELREVMKGYAMAALIERDVFGTDQALHAELGTLAAEKLIQSNSDLATLRAEIGSVEARISETQTETAAEIASLEMTKSDLVAIDPYSVAVELEATQTRLTSLYTLTARLSDLNLVNYLR